MCSNVVPSLNRSERYVFLFVWCFESRDLDDVTEGKSSFFFRPWLFIKEKSKSGLGERDSLRWYLVKG